VAGIVNASCGWPHAAELADVGTTIHRSPKECLERQADGIIHTERCNTSPRTQGTIGRRRSKSRLAAKSRSGRIYSANDNNKCLAGADEPFTEPLRQRNPLSLGPGLGAAAQTKLVEPESRPDPRVAIDALQRRRREQSRHWARRRMRS